MGGKLTFIKAVYWVGIIADLLSCVPLLLPEMAKQMYGLENLAASGEYLYVSRLAAALMLGWTLLLFWAVLRPVERKGVLLLTLFPVMCGIVITGILAVTSGLVAAADMVPVWLINGIIIIIFALAYYFATFLARNE